MNVCAYVRFSYLIRASIFISSINIFGVGEIAVNIFGVGEIAVNIFGVGEIAVNIFWV